MSNRAEAGLRNEDLREETWPETWAWWDKWQVDPFDWLQTAVCVEAEPITDCSSCSIDSFLIASTPCPVGWFTTSSAATGSEGYLEEKCLPREHYRIFKVEVRFKPVHSGLPYKHGWATFLHPSQHSCIYLSPVWTQTRPLGGWGHYDLWPFINVLFLQPIPACMWAFDVSESRDSRVICCYYICGLLCIYFRSCFKL